MGRHFKDGVGLGCKNCWVKESLQESIAQYREHSQHFEIAVHGV